MPQFTVAVDALEPSGPLVVGGKSMGGRVGSMVADDLHGSGKIAGLICFGYSFHLLNKPENLCKAHLTSLRAPALIFEGTRDPFATDDEVSGSDLSGTIRVCWMPDGDHDLKPRKRITGLTQADYVETMAREAFGWIRSIV